MPPTNGGRPGLVPAASRQPYTIPGAEYRAAQDDLLDGLGAIDDLTGTMHALSRELVHAYTLVKAIRASVLAALAHLRHATILPAGGAA